MFRSPCFLEDEHSSPLLARNFHFVKEETLSQIIQRVESWKDLISNYHDIELLDHNQCNEEQFLRIFRKDAERTYVLKEHDKDANDRTLLRHTSHIKILQFAVAEIKDYHQGMGYIAAFLGLFLSEEDAAKIIIALHRSSEKYCNGYFAAVPTRFVSDARVVFEILRIEDPEMLKLLQSKGIFPEMFMSKWFIGLCLHVLPYEILFDFYEAFFQDGFEFLVKFALVYFHRFKELIMKCKSTSQLMTILRAEDENSDWKLPKSIKPEDFKGIVEEAKSKKLPEEVNLEKLREEEFIKMAQQVENARKRAAEMAAEDSSDDEGNFTDDE
jgi:Rab-GTPase-TBC domain